MEKSGKRVRTAEEEWLASLDSATDSQDLEAVGRPRDVSNRLHEMERAWPGRPGTCFRPSQLSPSR